ncbi:MAG: hypothetical protein M1812_005478 [Candelaria pacifica]|nr:MAG: hypothetical protein M1812_005478 [Candelaria pacifica]
MSDPYNQYPPNYGSPAPSQGHYPQQGPGYDQQQQQPGGNYGYPPQQPGYGYGAPTPDQQGGYPPPAPSYGEAPYGQPNAGYGPPAQGGFQHGQQATQYGAYDQGNPQSQVGYPAGHEANRDYGPPSQPMSGQFPQQGAYNQAPYPGDPNNPNPQAYPVDPNAPEGERGLGGSLAGGAAGYFLGRKKNHGFLGAVGGALAGNFAQDHFMGDKKKDKKHESGYGGSSHGGSSFGGKW